MDILQETKENKHSFFNHVFSTNEESKAEVFNVVQYAMMGVIPVVILNKLVQQFVPEAEPDKSTLEIVVEMSIQLIMMFCGIIVIHRIITYFPTYSGFKYEGLALTNVILAFLIIVLSIQTKLGIKANILVDRVNELWNGSSVPHEKKHKNVRVSQHNASQADHLDMQSSDMFPPAPIATSKPNNQDMRSNNGMSDFVSMGPMAANSMLGGAFGSLF